MMCSYDLFPMHVRLVANAGPQVTEIRNPWDGRLPRLTSNCARRALIAPNLLYGMGEECMSTRIGTPINGVLCTYIPSLAGFFCYDVPACINHERRISTAIYPSRVRRPPWKFTGLLVGGYTITTSCGQSPQKLLKCKEAVIWFHLLERSVGLAIYCGGRMCFCWHYLPCQP